MRRDKAFVAVILFQPLMMLLLFGLAISTKTRNVPWVILDESRTGFSRRFGAEAFETGYFRRPVMVGSYHDGVAALRQGRALALLVVPASFRRDAERGRASVQLLIDGTDPISAARVEDCLRRLALAFDMRPNEPGARPGEHEIPTPLDVRRLFLFNPNLSDRLFFFSALAGMLLSNLCLSVTSLGLVGERESGTYEQLLALPTSPLELVLGKLLPHVGMSYVVLLLTTLGAALFGIWPRGSWVALIAVTLPFVLGSLAIGIFVSTLARTSAEAVFITVFVVLPSLVGSGALVPYQLIPEPVRHVGAFLPLRWYQIALRQIIERGAGFADIVPALLALTAFLAVMLVLIQWRMRPRLT